jgi:hypothetical protein
VDGGGAAKQQSSMPPPGTGQQSPKRPAHAGLASQAALPEVSSVITGVGFGVVSLFSGALVGDVVPSSTSKGAAVSATIGVGLGTGESVNCDWLGSNVGDPVPSSVVVSSVVVSSVVVSSVGSWVAGSSSTGWSVASPSTNARGSASHRSGGTFAHIAESLLVETRVSASCESVFVPPSPPASITLLLLSTESVFKNLPRYNRTKSARLGRMEIEGCIEGAALCFTDGARLGAALREGRTDGFTDGARLGAEDTVGAALMDGRAEGCCEGFVLGGDEIVGLFEGCCDGFKLGGEDIVGLFEGCCDGFIDGGDEMVGAALMDGLADGRVDGPGEGAADTEGA